MLLEPFDAFGARWKFRRSGALDGHLNETEFNDY